MDAYEATRIVFSRIQTLDPENAAKIMGLLLIQDHGEKEMIRLAFGPETLVHSVVLKARKELGLLPPSTPSTPSSSPSPFSRQNSITNSSRLSSSGLPSPSSWAPPPVFSRSNSTNGVVMDDLQNQEDIMVSSSSSASISPFYGGEFIDDLQLQDQLSFLNDPSATAAVCCGTNSSPNSSIHGFPIGPPKTPTAGADLFYSDMECRSPSSNGGDSMMFPYMNWGAGVSGHHRRSCSMADLYLSSDAAGFGWKQCLYFARGFCKNGSSCRFQHGLPDDVSVAAAAAAMSGSKMDAMVEQQCQELLLRSKSQKLGSVASSQLMGSAASFPYATSAPSPTSVGKCMNFLLQQQQQSESQRAAAAAAAALMLGGDESHKFFGRPRMDRYDYAGLVNPGSRQIYLTFPADSTFREEDVSNYFSIYGPVQDVRIPYQQKRMFGFVTFVYPETVKLILAKGNPHFVCDARVLVKPYKEKGKVPDKYRKLQQQQLHSERGDFSGCSTPTGLDSRDPYDLQQLGARMLYSNNQELLLRRKLEEQQQAADLQQAIELQGRRFMGLQLLDLKNRSLSSLSSASPIHTPTAINTPTSIIPTNNNHEEIPLEGGKCSAPVSAGSVLPLSGGEQQNNKATTVNAGGSADKEESAAGGEGNLLTVDGDFQESNAEHNLPDSPFASPTKYAFTGTSFSMVSEAMEMTSINTNTIINNNSNSNSSLLLGPTSLDMASIKSCFFPMPRFSPSGHGAVGL